MPVVASVSPLSQSVRSVHRGHDLHTAKGEYSGKRGVRVSDVAGVSALPRVLAASGVTAVPPASSLPWGSRLFRVFAVSDF